MNQEISKISPEKGCKLFCVRSGAVGFFALENPINGNSIGSEVISTLIGTKDRTVLDRSNPIKIDTWSIEISNPPSVDVSPWGIYQYPLYENEDSVLTSGYMTTDFGVSAQAFTIEKTQ